MRAPRIPRNDLTAEYVRSLLHYDPPTGALTWRATGKRADRTFKRRRDSVSLVGSDGRRHLYLTHRVAWLWMTGSWPQHTIDHIDQNPENNRWDNLREATLQEQAGNKRNSRPNPRPRRPRRDIPITKESLRERYDYRDGNLYLRRTGKCREWKNATKTSYGLMTVGKKISRVYNFIWVWHYGPIPEGFTVDHINRDWKDNRIENLRLATPSEQSRNRTKSPRPGTGP